MANRQNRGAFSACSQRRERGQAGQSAVVAIIVLFLLLFVVGLFLAIVSRNIDNTKRAANTSASVRYAEAGINYLDQQLTNSPQGADWRPVPDCTFGTVACSNPNITESDPDWRWLRPCSTERIQQGETCGYTRVNFGNDNPIPGNRPDAPSVGGRALVRVTYRPNIPGPNANDPLSRYIRLDAVGRVGQINPSDPTTYGNTEGLSLRAERIAYKTININEYARQITNKDNKAVTASLGTSLTVLDRGTGLSGQTPADRIAPRSIVSIYNGPIRVNAGLRFFGENYLYLNPRRGDALEVAGPIQLNNVADTIAATSNNDATRLFVTIPANTFTGQTNDVPYPVLPSGSANFTTLGPEIATLSGQTLTGLGLVRDNPRGSETRLLPNQQDITGNRYQNLRAVTRITPPTIDNEIGANGLTRYRALTRDSVPLSPTDLGPNPLSASIQNQAGQYGWGQNLYLNNKNDRNQGQSALQLYSVRNDWLNPTANVGNYWNENRTKYNPPGVTITLTPRYMILERYQHTDASRNYAFRNNTGGQITETRIIRYTPVSESNALPAETTVADNQKFAGYPARGGNNLYTGEMVIYAEGNVRIRGVVGGYDAQTNTCFKRHLTVVSNGTIYVEGNLLRDNITNELVASPPAGFPTTAAQNVRGQSTISLLAKDYVAVNTTQFTPLTYSQKPASGGEGQNGEPPVTSELPPLQQINFNMIFGPVSDPRTDTSPATPVYLATTATDAQRPKFFLRHAKATSTSQPENAIIRFVVNPTGVPVTFLPFTNLINPGQPFGDPVDPTALVLTGGRQDFVSDVFPFGATIASLVGFENNGVLYIDDRDPSTGNVGINYANTRLGVAPLDIRIDALMYAQEGSFFIIPGPWFNPNPNDTLERFINGDDGNPATSGPDGDERQGHRADEVVGGARPYKVNPFFPFYRQPMDIRITLNGAISENLTAEPGDQDAWLEKWGWIPNFYGSTGLTEATDYPAQGVAQSSLHGQLSSDPTLRFGDVIGRGSGIVYTFDNRALAPYAPAYNATPGAILRQNPYNPTEPLPFSPALPVAPGLLYVGQNSQ